MRENLDYMILDSFTNRECKKIQRAYERTVVRNRRATLAAMICVTYDSFHKTQLYRICSQNNCSYAEAEKCSVEYSDAFGVDIPTDAFLPNEDKYSDLAISCYNDYVNYRKFFLDYGYTIGDIDAFCKMVFFDPERYDMCHFRAFNSVGYMYAMIGVYDYLCGKVDEIQMLSVMQIYEPGGMKPMTDTQIRSFAKTMIKVVDAFMDIYYKRAERNEKTSY